MFINLIDVFFYISLVDLKSKNQDDFACIFCLGKQFWKLMQTVCL